jgi:Ca2+-binding EF-hand superfamily protein
MKTPRKPGLRGESVPVQRKSTVDGSKDNNKFQEKAQKHGLTQEQVAAFKEVFDLFDEDGGGTIDAEELDNATKSVDCAMTPEEIAEVLSIIDEDGKQMP